MSLFKFAEPFTAEEAQERFILIEDRGDRVLVQEVVVCAHMRLRPMFTYTKAELVPCED